MKIPSIILALVPLLFGACNQDQAKLLQMRDEFQRQLDAKDKQIEELMRKLADSKGGGGSVDTDALASKLSQDISKAVAQETSQQLGEITKRLDAIDKQLGQGRLANNAAPAPAPPPAAPQAGSTGGPANTRPSAPGAQSEAPAKGKGGRPVIRFDNF